MNCNISKKYFTKEYFLFLLPFFFVFHEYNENVLVISFGQASALFLKYVLATYSVYLISFFLVKSWRKASVFTVLVMSFYFFFGAFHDATKNIFNDTLLTKYSFIIPASIICLILLLYLIKKSQRKFIRFTIYCNTLLLLLIVFDAADFAIPHVAKKQQYRQASGNPVLCDTCETPDIYFIVADGYAGDQQLREVLHFDNAEFLNALRSRGFYVVANSKSNYNLTPYSVASIVNMDYLPLKSSRENKEDLFKCFSSINSNPLISLLKNYQYQIENYSIFRFGNKTPLINSQFLKVGMDAISSQTLFGRMERDVGFNLITKYKFKWAFKNAAERGIEQIEKLYKKTMDAPLEIQSHPRFIYTHLMMPHYPYYFDKDGNRYDYEMILEKNWPLKKEYSEYLQYTNKKLLELFDQILSKSAKPPIIVFMGDHGFREFSSEGKDTNYYFMNMNALYLPKKNYANFYEGMSNVNQFRMLLNTVFHQNFSTLKDSSILIN